MCVCVCVLLMTTVTTGQLLELAEKNVELAVVEDMAGQFEEAYELYMRAFISSMRTIHFLRGRIGSYLWTIIQGQQK